MERLASEKVHTENVGETKRVGRFKNYNFVNECWKRHSYIYTEGTALKGALYHDIVLFCMRKEKGELSIV